MFGLSCVIVHDLLRVLLVLSFIPQLTVVHIIQNIVSNMIQTGIPCILRFIYSKKTFCCTMLHERW